jgi:3-isopropylmalate dehydrogenase
VTPPTNPRIAYLPGDGIGPEVLAVARRVLEAAGFRATWVDCAVGWSEWQRHGEALPAATLAACKESDAIFFGAITSKPADVAEQELAPGLRGRGLQYRSPVLRLRQELELFANIRPIQSYAGNPRNLREDVDLVIFRENTEDLYAGVEARPFPASLRAAWAATNPGANLPSAGPDTAVSLRVITRAATERLVRAAFEHARTHRRTRVTLVEKPNVMRATGGLVREVFFAVAKEFPGLHAHEENVDAACAHLARSPQDYQVIVATNLFGDILSDLAAEVAGGLPLAASANIGARHALFEPVHGSAPDIAGRGVANPLGAVLAGAMMASHVGQPEVSRRIDAAVRATIRRAQMGPADIGGKTADMEQALLAGLPLARA